MAQALVPLKALVDAKTRLADLLSPGQRRSLVAAMAEDVLQGLASHPDLDRVILISDDPAAHELAQRCNVDYWPEQGLGEPGLNSLVAGASRRMLATGSSPLLVLHADLPLLDSSDIDAVLALQARNGGLVVCCDRAGTGTNLLAFGVNEAPQFCFGVDSCAAHVDWAGRAGVSVQIVRRLGCALDIDTAGDLSALLQTMPPGQRGHTAQLLRDSAISRQIEHTHRPAGGAAESASTSEGRAKDSVKNRVEEEGKL